LAVADEGFYHCEVYHAAAPYPTPDPAAVSTEAQVMTPRLVAHWAFEDNLDDSVDDIGAVIAGGDWPAVYTDPNVDNSAPTPVYVAGIPTGGLALDLSDPNEGYFGIVGGNDVWADSNDLFNFYSQGFTATCWLKGAANGGDYQLAVSKQSDNTAGWGIGRSYDEAFSNFRGAGVYPDHTGGAAADGVWTLVAITYDPADSGYRLYSIDPQASKYQFMEALGTATVTPPLTTAPVVLGVETIGGASPLTGLLDEAKIYSYVLTPEEIAAEYEAVTGNTPCMSTVGLDFDWDGNCTVDLPDFAVFAETWLNTQLLP